MRQQEDKEAGALDKNLRMRTAARDEQLGSVCPLMFAMLYAFKL